VLLWPLGARVLRDPRAIAARWRYLLAVGLLGVGSYNALQYLALVTTTPLNVTLIAAGTPVTMLAVGALAYGEHPTRRQLAGALLSIAGVLLVITRGAPAALAEVRFVRGDLYIVVAIVAWSFYSWRLARPPASMRGAQAPTIARPNGEDGWNWAEFLLVQTLYGLLGAGAAAAGEFARGAAPIQWNGWVLAAFAFVAIGPSVIAYRCWGLGVARGGPALAAFFGNLTPVFAALLGALALGEAPRWFHALAFALIVAGIVVSSRRMA
jgi:drug/metabolite transporter (DMT)-like permease